MTTLVHNPAQTSATTQAAKTIRRTGRRGNNEGSITQIGEGRWQARVTLAGGKRKAFYGKTRAEAAAKLTEALRDRDRGLPVVAEKQTVGQYLTSWLEMVQPTIRPRTWRRYGELLTLHVIPSLGKVPIARLTAQQVQQLYSAKIAEGLSTTTVHHVAMVLHKALGQAERLGLVARNVTELVDAPRMAHHDMRVLDREEVHRLLEAAREDRLGVLYILAVSTGMRQGELLGLCWSDIDLDRGVVQVRATLQWGKEGSYTLAPPKTRQSRRQVALTTVAREALRIHRIHQSEEHLATGIGRGKDDLVFTSPSGNAVDGRNVTRTNFASLLKRAGLPALRFHDLRHTAATLLLGQGVNPKIVSEMLGHTKIGITLDIYSHVLPDMQQQAAAAMEAVLVRQDVVPMRSVRDGL